MTTVLALIGAKALYLLYIWLASAITDSEVTPNRAMPSAAMNLRCLTKDPLSVCN